MNEHSLDPSTSLKSYNATTVTKAILRTLSVTEMTCVYNYCRSNCRANKCANCIIECGVLSPGFDDSLEIVFIKCPIFTIMSALAVVKYAEA